MTASAPRPMAMPASASFSVRDGEVRVHAIRTGTVTIKRCHHTCCLPERSPMALRFAAILGDRRFADPLPIWTFVIEHPERTIVVDAGATPDYNDDSSWRRDRRGGSLIRSFIRIGVEPEETLPAQMIELGVSPADVDAVVLTHQHIDHTASVPAFANATIWTTKAEDRAAQQVGAFWWRWRNADTTIGHVDVEGAPQAGDPQGFLSGVDLTSDGAIRASHTPGHTPGSVSVRLRTDACTLWFTGDTSFTARSMNPTEPTAGIHTDMRAVRTLHASLRGEDVILPSHDWDNPERLERAGRVVK